MLTFKNDELKIRDNFSYAAGAILSLIQYKQTQDWLTEIGFCYEDQKQLDSLLAKMAVNLFDYHSKQNPSRK